MRDMCTLAQFLINLQKATSNSNFETVPTTAEAIFELKHLKCLETAVSKMCRKPNGDCKDDFKLHIGNILKTTAGILQADYLLSQQKEKMEEVKEFEILLNYKWRH